MAATQERGVARPATPANTTLMAKQAIAASRDIDGEEILAGVFLNQRIEALTSGEQLALAKALCDRLGLSLEEGPFQLVAFRGGMKLYPTANCAEQIRSKRKISITHLIPNFIDTLGLYTVEAHAQDESGRTDIGTGAVFLGGIEGEEAARRIKIAETQAKRRVTFSMCGLSAIEGKLDWNDETVADDAARITKRMASGSVEVHNPASAKTRDHLHGLASERNPTNGDIHLFLKRCVEAATGKSTDESLTGLTEAQAVATIGYLMANYEAVPKEEKATEVKATEYVPDLENLLDLAERKGKDIEDVRAVAKEWKVANIDSFTPKQRITLYESLSKLPDQGFIDDESGSVPGEITYDE